MTTPLQERIRLLADAAGSLRRVDAAAGLQFGHAHAIAEGRISKPTLETYEQIAKGCGVSFDWVAFGRGDPPDPEAVRAHVDAARDTDADEVAA
jgi:hypothetical protein